MLAFSSKKEFKSLISFLECNEIKYFIEYNMSDYVSWRVGAITPIIIYPNNLEQLKNLIKKIKSLKIKFYISGNGSNVLFVKLSKTIIISTKKLNKIRFFSDGSLTAESGASLNLVLNRSLKNGLVGFEFSTGIPGTVGGALITNAGANGGTISECLKSVFFLKNNNEIEVERDEIDFDYRYSSIKRNDIITKAKFQLKKGDTKKAKENIKKYIRHRNNTQPVEYPSAGSVFMNTKESKAGKTIQDLHLKGYSIGGAKISELHANYIINTGGAKIQDIKTLIQKIRKIVKDKDGTILNTEVKIVEE